MLDLRLRFKYPRSTLSPPIDIQLPKSARPKGTPCSNHHRWINILRFGRRAKLDLTGIVRFPSDDTREFPQSPHSRPAAPPTPAPRHGRSPSYTRSPPLNSNPDAAVRSGNNRVLRRTLLTVNRRGEPSSPRRTANSEVRRAIARALRLRQ